LLLVQTAGVLEEGKAREKQLWVRKWLACRSTRGGSALLLKQWHTQEFFRGGVKQIQLRTEDRKNGDLGAVAP
jgi:hypothetical protein